jgi:hypothetical protein
MPNSIHTVQVSDTRDDDSSNAADTINRRIAMKNKTLLLKQGLFLCRTI